MQATIRTTRVRSARPDVRGFTLVELVVIIGILAILMGLLLPSLSRSYGSAKNTRSLMTMQQASLLVEQYTSQNQDVYPLADYPTVGDCGLMWYKPLQAVGLIDGPETLDPAFTRENVHTNMLLSISVLASADLMKPGHTVPTKQVPPMAVHTYDVLHTSAKGILNQWKGNDGSVSSLWCCVPGAPRGPVAFADGSCGVYAWPELLGDRTALYIENGVGSPVFATWQGWRGRDKP